MNDCVTVIDSISGTAYIVKTDSTKKIPVKVHIPDNVSEGVRQKKINRIYDLLNPEIT